MKARIALGITLELFQVSTTPPTDKKLGSHPVCLQRIANIPAIYLGLRDAVLDCQRHFDVVVKDARATFTNDGAGRALDDWMTLVIQSAAEIKAFYSKSSLSKPAL